MLSASFEPGVKVLMTSFHLVVDTAVPLPMCSPRYLDREQFQILFLGELSLGFGARNWIAVLTICWSILVLRRWIEYRQSQLTSI